MQISRVAEYPRPDHVLLHFSDTHLVAGDRELYGAVDSEQRLRRLLERARGTRITPTALVFTGDLTDRGEAGAYDKLRALVEPVAAALGAPVVWLNGNHDDRATLRRRLLDEDGSADPLDRVYLFDGLRIVTLDTTVPGEHHGEISDDQLAWLGSVLAEPAPFGTILAMHHPPIPYIQDLAVTVELRDQRRLADVLDGTDVRSILSGHLHFSTTATFAGIPVSVVSSAAYSQDPAVQVGGQRGRDAVQAFNFVHIYPDTVVHSVVPIEEGPTVGRPVTPAQTAEELTAAGIVIPPATGIPHVVQRRAGSHDGETVS
ncbi:metallophosphoesterase [Nocardia sp. alder85J]|uniref:metallophosphoesterase n=1 Tax=Nocardia sp. alder85J TaxID=2862949 RepID=UPI001CD70F50|nr:metallophosphoesterase [Nocardia sp. alder85J]MCX4096188.1 metallophosphoesterase [Nocardia sp. alder85J]